MLKPKKFVRRTKRGRDFKLWLPRVVAVIRLVSILLSVALAQAAEAQADNPLIHSLVDFLKHVADAASEITQ